MHDGSIPSIYQKPFSMNNTLPPDSKEPVGFHTSGTTPEQNEELSDSAWAKMFPSGATKKDLAQFISTFLKDLISQMRHQDKIHAEHMRELKAKIEDG
jgi:hypothetical protein